MRMSEADVAFFQKRDELRACREHLENLVDSMIWMSGSDSFSYEGEAHAGWVSEARPRLFAAMAYLERTK